MSLNEPPTAVENYADRLRKAFNRKLEFPPLPDIKFPPYEKVTLPNGLVIFVLEDKTLPLVSGVAYFNAGGRWDSPEITGLAEITGSVLRSGGSVDVPGNKLDQILEQRAASIESAADRSVFSVGFSALSDDLEFVLELFAGVMRRPAFPEEKLALSKMQAEAFIARRNDEPGGIAGREAVKAIYGEANPYVRNTEYATVRAITTDHLKRFHSTYFCPNNAVLGIVGNVDAKTVINMITRFFGDWERNTSFVAPPLPPVEQANAGKIILIDRPELTQSYVQFGQVGGTVKDADYPALAMLNGCLNGFGGLLFNEVRSRQGLAYSVYASWSPQFDHPGLFLAGGETGGDVAQFITSINAVINELRTTPPSQALLTYARDSTLNSFVFNFSSSDSVLSRLLRYQFFNYPFDYIFQFKTAIEKCSGTELMKAAAQHIRPESFVYTIVGPAATVRPSLGSLGLPIVDKDVSIPPP